MALREANWCGPPHTKVIPRTVTAAARGVVFPAGASAVADIEQMAVKEANWCGPPHTKVIPRTVTGAARGAVFAVHLPPQQPQ
eukprot:366157-Chlamydomonas_euryale.AAC.4